MQPTNNKNESNEQVNDINENSIQKSDENEESTDVPPEPSTETSKTPSGTEEPTEGLIIIFDEQQNGTINHHGEDQTLQNQGTLTVKNKTGGPIYDFKLQLGNLDDTNIPDKIEKGFLQTFDGEGMITDYSPTKDTFMCTLQEDLNFQNGLVNPVTIKSKETPLTINLALTNVTNGPLSINLSKILPSQLSIETLPTVEHGELTKGDQLTWNISKLAKDQAAETTIETKLYTEEIETFDSGEIKYKTKGNGFTMTGITVDTVKAGVIDQVNETTEKKERVQERAVWDISITVENTCNTSVKAIGKIGVLSGTILGEGTEAISEEEETEEAPSLPGRVEQPIPGKREYPQIVATPVSIPPNTEKTIGPFPIESETEPRLTVDVDYEINPTIIKRVSGTYQVDAISIPCLHSTLEKTVKVRHSSAASGLAPDELMSNLEEPAEVKVELENTGSAPIDYLELVETVPAGFKPPNTGNIQVELDIGNVEGMEIPEDQREITVQPADPMEQNEVAIRANRIQQVFEEPMQHKDQLNVNYEVTALSPEASKTYQFPSTCHVAISAEDSPTSFPLEKIPELTTAEIKREIRKQKKIAPGTGEKEFTVTAILKNDGTLPVEDYEFVDIVPENFELLEESISPEARRIQETPRGKEVNWTIEKIPPNSQEEVQYTVKGLTGFKVSNLKKVRG